jgi:multidrug efflux system membrane fusion protein
MITKLPRLAWEEPWVFDENRLYGEKMKPISIASQKYLLFFHIDSGAGVFLLTLLGCLALFSSCSGDKPLQHGTVKPVVSITVGMTRENSVPVQLKAIGNVEAYATVEIKPRVGGELKIVHFKEGDEVKKGDLLFTIDPRPFEAYLRAAEAKLAQNTVLAKNALSDYHRYVDLVRKNFVSREQYDQVRANAESLQAAIAADKATVETARLELSYCYIFAAIPGRTGKLLSDQGTVIKANPDNPMVVINQIQPIYVNFSVPEQFLGEIKKYMAAGNLEVLALIPREESRPIKGVLAFVDNAVDMATGTIKLRATFDNEEKRLWPGQFVNAVLTLTIRPKAVLVPSVAVQTGQQGQYVFVVKPDSTVESRLIAVAGEYGESTVVETGLEPGTMVVTDGQFRLVPGDKVEVKNPLGSSGGKQS